MVGLEEVNCDSGDTLAKEHGEASTKEDVVKAVGDVASSVRAKLGESLAKTASKHDQSVAVAGERVPRNRVSFFHLCVSGCHEDPPCLIADSSF
jgi:hypothetical protein